MKSFHALLLFFFLSTTFLFSQIDSFDISQYTLREVELKRLDFSASLGGNSQSISTTVNVGAFSSFSNTLGLGYSHFVSNSEFQKEAYFSLFNNFSFRNTGLFMGLASNDIVNNRTRAYIIHTKRLYLEPKRFIDLTYDINIENTLNSAVNNGGIRYLENQLQLNFSIPLQYGFGRIEPVTDAWHAVRILKDFKDLNILSRDPTQHEIKALAKVLSNLAYDRIFDHRLARIRHIQILDEHIASSGLVDKFDAVYFTSLYDMYQFGIQKDRFSGERFSFGLEPQGRVSSNSNSDNTGQTHKLYTLALLAVYDLNNPLSQKWQFDFHASLRTGIEGGGTIVNSYFIKPEFSISSAYYPNSRTSFEAQFRVSSRYATNPFFITSSNRFQYYSALSGTFNYYLSPRTRLEANLVYQYAHNSYLGSVFGGITPIGGIFYNNGFNFNYGISIKHAIY